MTQQPGVQTVSLQVTPQFASSLPALPAAKQVDQLAPLAATADTRQQLVCRNLLQGNTVMQAKKEAADILPKMLDNTQVLAVFGTDALAAVNALNDRMLNERPPVDIPELREAMRNLSRTMRGIGKKYNPNDPHVLKRYQQLKGGLLSQLHLVKSFLQEFLDDVRSLQDQFKQTIQTLEGKQYQLLKNVVYYSEFYRLNEVEIAKLIYKIGVMEIVRDMAADQAKAIKIGDANLGDRAGERQAALLEFVTLMENKIIAFKSRLWVAWAMAPQIRNMRAISVGISARIDQTIEITIPTMKDTIVVWFTLSEAEQAQQFNKAVEDTANQVMLLFAQATKAAVPALASAVATPALDPRVVVEWCESISAQADGMVAAIELGRKKRVELEQAMIQGKGVMDAATQRVNQARLNQVLDAARETPLEIAQSVPTQN